MGTVCVKAPSLELERRRYAMAATYNAVRILYASLWAEGMGVPQTGSRVGLKRLH